ncbi:uncharacterized protein LOC126888066 [Diabrotica virgifera virgifera]|uniref:Mab-21-like HhH/H2TH-like domain-containing protein n=1 Tax=Diabrotica virgifera virgifera TaxID=50390 RepID=A0ABM5KPD0_DIAVI|nr:uncharacterized protein LOC126888066 [Diabrotica virgifera virgifera]
MGNNCCSQEIDPDFPRPSEVQLRNNGGGSDRVDSRIRQDEQIIDSMKKEYRDIPDVFLLNNLLMTVQFFENYRRDIQKSTGINNILEKHLNKNLLQNESMECICPDSLFETVNSNMKFRPLHGIGKHSAKNLLPRRLFIVSDSVEVISSMDVPQYTSIDKPAYQVRIEESSRKGFIRLKQIDNSKLLNMYSSLPELLVEASTSTDTDSTLYEYNTITDLKTPKPLEKAVSSERRDTLPSSCFRSKRVRKPDYELQDLQDQQDEGLEITEDDLFDTVIYVDAKGFMNYFKDVLFPNSLGRSLGFDQHEIDLARSIPGTVFCNFTDEEDNPISCEIIPSVSIPWPDAQTIEFIMREDRPTITDTSTGYRYKWPTDDMVKEICTFNCVAVPKGYWQKRGEYSEATLEWEIAFPKAERYLEARMSYAQMRCFLFLLVIHKHYIEPVTQRNGLLAEHIRCHMYWECEANSKDWPEHKLGTKILKVVSNLYKRLSTSELPDFFIKQKNHFRNIPRKYLIFAQKIFNELTQSPIVYFLRALRCLRYSTGKFYPPFEYKKFYNMLTQQQGYTLVNPNMLERPPNARRKVYEDADKQWRHLVEMKRRNQILEEKKQKEKAKQEEDTKSVDSIDIEWTCDKPFDIFKTKAILTQFITIYIDIAKDSYKFGLQLQPLFYLKQAFYLTRMLESTSSAFTEEAREFKFEIEVAENTYKRSLVKSMNDVPPATPLRNSIQFDYQLSQQLKSNVNLNLTNLYNSYNSAAAQVGPSASFNKRSSVVKLKKKPSDTHAMAQRMSTGASGVPRKSVMFVEPERTEIGA